MDLSVLKSLKGSKITAKVLSAALVEAIESGTLAPGAKLPSTRDIADYLELSKTTVVKVYKFLSSRGYISSSPGAGTWVSAIAQTRQAACSAASSKSGYPWESRYSSQATNLQSLSLASLDEHGLDEHAFDGRDFDELAFDGRDIGELAFDEINFGATPPDLLPLRQWRKAYLRVCDSLDRKTFAVNQDVFGYRPLREAIAGFLRRSKGIVCEAEQVVLASGVQSVVSPVMNLLVNAGDLAVCENPGFYGAREQFRCQGARVLTVDVDREGLIVDQLAAINGSVQWLYVAPSCQEPTGVMLSEQRRHQLLSFCEQRGAAILEDDWDSEFHYGKRTVPSLFSLDKTGSVIYFYSFWRLLYPLTSVGFLLIPHALIGLFERFKNVWQRQFTLVEHQVLTELLSDGQVEEHIGTMWKECRQRRQALIFSLTERFKGQVEVVSSNTGGHVVARFSGDLSAPGLIKAAQSVGLPAALTTPYYDHSPVQGEIMFRFAGLAPSQIEARVKALAAAML